jgi:hypothetical protein
MSVLGQTHFTARHVPKSEGSLGLGKAQTETCKGVLLMLQMDDLAAKHRVEQTAAATSPQTEAHPLVTPVFGLNASHGFTNPKRDVFQSTQ